ncbi:MAG: Rossmann-like and DUF2520 domain-containing protein [Mangrovibacterium sp.]
MIKTISLIGAGNLATRLGIALREEGLQITQVYSRTEESARELAEKLDCDAVWRLEDVTLDADLILFAVKDDALDSVLRQLPLYGKLIVHTAGSLPLSVLAPYSNRYGVFYPLQTFSKQREFEFIDIPICLEASDIESLDELDELAWSISEKVKEVNSEQRLGLHLAAVFVCNFVNHFYTLGAQIVEKLGFDFDLLKTLICETTDKIIEMKPFDAQTGPAKRFEETIINKHLDFLSDQPELKEIYRLVSKSIFEAHKPQLK